MEHENQEQKEQEEPKKHPIKSYTRQELIAMYNIKTYKTFTAWLLRGGLVFKYIQIFTPKQVAEIFEALGEP